MNKGIDYSCGSGVNRDKETGIRYGIISQHDVMSEAMEDIYTQGEDLDFMEAVEDFKRQIARVENEGELASLFHDNFLRRCNPDLWAEAIALDMKGRGLAFETPEATEFIWNEVQQTWSDRYENTGDCTRYLYERDGYKIQIMSDGDVWVMESPFVTYAQFCSPCAPGACYLTNPLDEAVESNKCYCLGADWFEDNKAPYPIHNA